MARSSSSDHRYSVQRVRPRSNSIHNRNPNDVFDEDGNFKQDLPSSVSPSFDADGNPTLLQTPREEEEEKGGFGWDETASLGIITDGERVQPIERVQSPGSDTPQSVIEGNGEEDLEPGTTTEEEYLESELESELIAEERRQKAKKKASKEVFVGRKRAGWGWWAWVGGAAKTKSLFWFVLRWPLLIFFGVFMLLDLICYSAIRQWVRWYEWAIVWRGKRRVLRERLLAAKNYEDYKVAARHLDEHLKNNKWKSEEYCPFYDVDLIHRTVRRLKRYRLNYVNAANNHSSHKLGTTKTQESQETSIRTLQKILQHGACKANFGNLETESLYSYTYLGSKHLVEEYVNELCLSLETVADSNVLSTDGKRELFKKAGKDFGRTALCLSGGATLGYYHMTAIVGVVKTLFENGVLPTIITGTSAGSLIAALICCSTDRELEAEILRPSIHQILTACDLSYFERLRRLIKTGAMFDHREWYQKTMSATRGPLTFLEAYQRTGRVLNIAIVPDEPHSPFKLCNYITTPNVVVATAVMASSAVPGVLNPIELLMKEPSGQIVPFRSSGRRWRDGSLMMDIPESELHRLWNVNFTIVSQVNPHIVLFFFDRRGSAGQPTAHRHGQGWRGGFVASALVHHFKLDLQKWMLLTKDFDLLPRILGTDVSDVFLQRFEGTVTIVPKPVLQDYRYILDDPTEKRMKWYISQGEKQTFPKLHMILNRMRIEKTLGRIKRSLGSERLNNGSVSSRRGSRLSVIPRSAEGASPRWMSGVDEVEDISRDGLL
ncbi:acyl transferase/acyl hydrolase/lysophospholipase [Phlyctochytrium arcticum]|nr:acyl transferase/acyl hydrolase/lysophospholipase [Phlyctochytrium arcticum]